MIKMLESMRGDSYHEVDGHLVPKFVTKETLDKLKTFKLYPEDVWVVTYPKSGTTWMQQIVRLIRNNGETNDVTIDVAVPYPAAAALFSHVNLDDLPHPRAFKSHSAYHLMPCGPPHTTPCKYIYVARNPKDVAVSFYFQNKLFYPDMDWDAFMQKFVKGDLEYGNYFDHILSWWPHREDKHILFLKYEDMKRDLSQVISQVASFLGVQLSNDMLKKITSMSSFEAMKNDNSANYSWVLSKMQHQFLRKGIVGDWKNFLSAEQSAELDSISASKFKGTGLEFDCEL